MEENGSFCSLITDMEPSLSLSFGAYPKPAAPPLPVESLQLSLLPHLEAGVQLGWRSWSGLPGTGQTE